MLLFAPVITIFPEENYIGTGFKGNHTFGVVMNISADDSVEIYENIIYRQGSSLAFREFTDAFGNNS